MENFYLWNPLDIAVILKYFSSFLQVENTIRWRYRKDEEGNEIKESNARVVRWSDGTTSLLLGEVFDVHKNEIDGNCNHLFVQQVCVTIQRKLL